MRKFLQTLFFERDIKSSKEAFLYLFLGLSPIGALIPYFLIFPFFCEDGGSIGSEINCIIPLLGAYMGLIQGSLLLSSVFVVPGVAWAILAFRIWYKLFHYVVRPFNKKLW